MSGSGKASLVIKLGTR